MFSNADLLKHGVTHYDIDIVNDYREGTEYMRRLRAGLPIRPPHFQVGEWVYCFHRCQNVRVLFLGWDQGPPGHNSFWRLNVAGYGGPDEDFGRPRTDAPFVEVQCIGSSWADVHGPIAARDLPEVQS